MINRFIESLTVIAERYGRPISIVLMAWAVVSWAATSRFITLPQLDFIGAWPMVAASVAFNALWWGWLRPSIERRRTERAVIAAGKVSTDG